jgi:hypothetical protein
LFGSELDGGLLGGADELDGGSDGGFEGGFDGVVGGGATPLARL